jgi:hypothetical protein
VNYNRLRNPRRENRRNKPSNQMHPSKYVCISDTWETFCSPLLFQFKYRTAPAVCSFYSPNNKNHFKNKKIPARRFFIFKFRSCQTPWASRHIWLKVSRPRQKGVERRWRKYLKDGNNSFTCLLRDSLTPRRARWCQIRSINEERWMTLIVHCSPPQGFYTIYGYIEKGPKIISHLFF